MLATNAELLSRITSRVEGGMRCAAIAFEEYPPKLFAVASIHTAICFAVRGTLTRTANCLNLRTLSQVLWHMILQRQPS